MRAPRCIVAFAVLAALLSAAPARAGLAFHAVLDAFQAGAGDPDYRNRYYGECVGVANEPLEALSMLCVHNLSDATSATLRRGNPGETGPVLYTFATTQDPDCYWWLSEGDRADLILGRLYVLVTSPGGAIRGQIRLLQGNDNQLLYFDLKGEDVVPPVDTPALGQCGMGLAQHDPLGRLGWALTCRHTVASPTSFAVRRGRPGANGPVVLLLDDLDSPIWASMQNDDPGFPGLVSDLLAGNLYLEVRSAAHPAGEIRGQLDGCLGGPEALCLLGERFRVEMSFRTPTGPTKPARAVAVSANSGTFFYFRPDNREVLLKVLNGCAVNEHYWVFFAATTNVEFTVTVTDTRTGASRQYSNPQGHYAEPVLDSFALAVCP
jgi:hypothetical protein